MAENFAQFVGSSGKGAIKDVKNVTDAFADAGTRIKPTFQAAYTKATEGKPTELGMKVGSVAIGAYFAGHGINNIVRGATEKIEHPAHDGREVQNTTRIFWGGAETMIGLTALYFGLTKGSMGK